MLACTQAKVSLCLHCGLSACARLEGIHWGGGKGVLFLTVVSSAAYFSYFCHVLAQEESEDCALGGCRPLHNFSEQPELPGKQELPEPGRVWAEERLRPARPCAEEN